MGCTPFQRSLRNAESWVNDCAGVVTLKRCNSPAARQAQSSLAGAHANPGAAAQVEQGVDRQIFHRVFHFASGNGFAFADQATVLAAIAKPGRSAIAVTVDGRAAQRGGEGDNFLQGTFRWLL